MKKPSTLKAGSRQRVWWVRIGVGILVGLPLLYWVLTSGVFLRWVVLPRVGAALGSELTVQDISLSPFSSLAATGVRLTPKEGKPLVEIRELKVRYKLMAILGGTIEVDEVTVDSPVILIEDKADGTGNLNRLLASLPKTAPTPAKAPPRLAVRKVEIRGGEIALDRTDAAGGRTRVNLSGLGVGLDQLVTGESGRLTLNSAVRFEVGWGAGSGTLTGSVSSDTQVTLGENLLPKVAKGGIRVDLKEGTGGFKPYGGFGTALTVDLVPDDLRNLSWVFTQGGQELGSVAFKGPVDLTKGDMRLAYEVRGIDRRVLSILGTASGLDARQTTLGAAGRVEVSANASVIVSSGKLTVSKFSLGLPAGTTPEVDVTLDYRVSVNQVDKSLLLDTLDVLGRQDGNTVLKVGLDRGMNLSWAKAGKSFRDSTLTLKAGPIELGQWKAVLGSNAPTGTATLDAQIKSEESGKLLRYTLAAGIKSLHAALSANPIRDGEVRFQSVGRVTGFTDLLVESYEADVRAGGQRLAQINGLADYQTVQSQGGVQINVEAQIPALLTLVSVPGISLEQGTVKLSSTVSSKQSAVSVESSVSLSRLTGTVQGVNLKDYQATVAGTVLLHGPEIEIPRMTFAAQTGYAPGGSLDARIRYNTLKKSGSLDFKAVAINQSALAPFVSATLAPIRLVSVSLDSEGRAEFALDGRSAGKIQARISDLRVDDPSGRVPKAAMGIGFEVDGAHEGAISELKTMVIDLGATTRVTNRLEISGLLDLGTNAPKPSQVLIKSSGLDLTPWYDLFAGVTNAPATVASRPVAAGDPTREPPAIRLPVREFNADLDIATVYLRQISVKGLRGKMTAKDDTVALQGFGFELNGAPVTASARANLSQPGYDYEFHFNGEALPLTPVVNSFIPAMTGLAQGTLLARVDIQGAGVTGLGFQKSLNGKIAIEATNSIIRIPDRPIPLPALLTKIIPILPEQVNPMSLLRLIGKSAALGEPIRAIEAHAEIGKGVVNVVDTRVSSPAFMVTLGGDVRFAPVLDDSPVNLPVALAFASDGKIPAPRTVGRVSGTVGKTGFTADPLGMAAIVGSSIPVVGQLGGKGVEAIKSAGAELDKRAGAAIGKAGAALGNLVGGDTNKPGSALGGILKGVVQPSTNNASTNGSARPGLLDALPFGKGKK
jgi:hypothetical protein